jgi:recombination protein RecR
MLSKQKLIELFSKFPTIGPRTASRFVYYLIKLPREDFDNLLTAMKKLREDTRICSFCFNPYEKSDNDSPLCPICRNPSKDKTILCVVEKENDLLSIEKTNKYNGLYFILGGVLSGLSENDIKKIRIEQLEKRIKDADFKEIIIATNPTQEGETTALYLQRRLKPANIKITRLGRGLPIGGELEYADEQTLESALEGRK